MFWLKEQNNHLFFVAVSALLESFWSIFFTSNQILGRNNMSPKQPQGVFMLLMLMVFKVSGTSFHHDSLYYLGVSKLSLYYLDTVLKYHISNP